jgi:sugar phosphate isomerase/epimerase
MIPNNVDKTLTELSKIGYTEVETFDFNTTQGFWGNSPKEFLRLLKNNGITAPSGHYDSGKLLKDGNTEDLKKQIEAAVTIHSKYLTIPSINNEYRNNADDLKRLAERMNTAGTLCAAAGIRLGYHNHDFEFKKYGEQTGYDILLQETDPALVHFEMDIYWVTHGGYDPIAFFKKHPGRFPLWHVKDMSKTNRDDNTEIGSGSIDYVPIFKEAKTAGLEHFFVEQETNYNENPMHAAEISCEYIKQTLI